MSEIVNRQGQGQSNSIAMRMKKNREAFMTVDQARSGFQSASNNESDYGMGSRAGMYQNSNGNVSQQSENIY